MTRARSLLLVFLLALGARLGYYAFFPDRPVTVDDALSWDHTALNVLEGRGFLDDAGLPEAVRPPVYPLFLAGIYSVFGHSHLAVKLIQIFLSALTPILLFLIGRAAGFERSGLRAAFLCAAYPPLIVYSPILGSETLFIFLSAATVLCFLLALRENSLPAYGAGGLLLGISDLCRSTLSFFPFFLAFLSAFIRRNRKEVGWILAAAAISFLVVSPWTLRNRRAFGGFLLVNISAGQLFWVGTLADTKGRYVEGTYEGYRQFDGITHPIALERAYFRAGLENIRRSPLTFLKLTAAKFVRQWFEPIGFTLTARRSILLADLILGAHVLLVLLCFFGIFASFSQRRDLAPLYSLFIYFAIMHNIIAPMPRFRLPFEPYMILFAVIGLERLYRKARPE